MSRLLWISCVALLSWVGNAGQAWSQVCRQPDATAELVRQDLARYAFADHPGDKAVRDSLRLPQGGSTSVVTSESVCKKAKPAYEGVLAGTGHGFSGKVYVIQVGNTYAVFDPVYHWGPDPGHYKVVIFDSRWRKLSSYTP
jgi:hypothetical protein